LPETVVLTQPVEFRLDRVVEPVTVKLPVLVVVANQVRPEIDIDVPEAVPRIGVTKVGEVAKTFCPVPVLVVTKRLPEAVVWTVPAEFRLLRVVEPVA
jgi:hypothetical protein